MNLSTVSLVPVVSSVVAPLPAILGEGRLSPARARYWRALARRMAGRVDLIDPDRRSLRDLRQTLRGVRLYRASTGGRWGKSAAIVRL